MAKQTGVEIPIEVPTKQARKDVKDFGNFLKGQGSGLAQASKVIGASVIQGALGGIAGVVQGLSQVAGSPDVSFREQGAGIAGSGIQGALMAGGAMFGLPGVVIGGVVGEIVKSITDAMNAETQFVVGGARQSVQARTDMLAKAGVSMKDEEIVQMYSLYEKQFSRMFKERKRVAKLIDQNSSNIFSVIGNYYRRITDTGQ